MLHLKHLFSTLFLFAIFAPVHGQLINGNKINAQVRAYECRWAVNDEAYNEEVSFIVKGQSVPTAAGNPASLITTTYGADNGSCEQRDGQAADGTIGWGINKNVVGPLFNTTNIGFDVAYMAWEDDRGERCVYDDGDDERVTRSGRFGFTLAGIGVRNRWIDGELAKSSHSTMRFQAIYRFAAGDGNNSPLEFGTLASGRNYYHYNTNRSAPSYAHSRMGYSNSFSGTGYHASPDVLYSFALNRPMNVSIGMLRSETDLNYVIHLLDSNGQRMETAERFSGYSLCAGTYQVVIEGRGTSQGDFALEVRASSVSTSSVRPGTISAPSTRICAGDPLPTISSSLAASSGLRAERVYRWQRKTGNGAWQNISNSNVSSVTAPGDQPSTVIRFRRVASYCDVENYSNEISFSPASEDVSVGQIRLAGTLNIPPGETPGDITSSRSASATTAPATVFWQQKRSSATSWQNISGTTGRQAYTPPALSASTDFRRGVYGGCGAASEAEFSNVIRVNVIQPNGKISGRITSGQAPFVAGVAGVTVCASLTEAIDGAPAGTQRCTQTPTEEDGSYEITGLYYGPNTATYLVTPSLEGRAFMPTNRTSTLSSTNNTATANFNDTSSFTVSGAVQLNFAGENCPVPGVDVELKRNGFIRSTTRTDEAGNYAFTVNAVGDYTVEVNVPDRNFFPASQPVTVDRNHSAVNFGETTTHVLEGKVLAGCEVYFGKVVLTVTEADNCFSTTVETDEEGNYRIDLPAKAYFVSVSNAFDLEPGFDPLEIRNRLMSQTYGVDLTEEDQSLAITYHRKPVIEILGLPEAAPCGDYGYAVLDQGQSYPITINVYEGEIGGCPVDSALIYVTDAISTDNAQPDTVRISGGSMEYTIVPGAPNIIAPYLQTLSIGAVDTLGESESQTITALTTGSRAREKNFATTTPELPLMILRDPPGDASYSYLEESTQTQYATSFSALVGGSVNVWGEAKVGTKFTTGIGYSTEVKVWGKIKNSLEVKAAASSLTENILTITATDRFATSGNQLITGTEGDVFMGAAMNLVYAITDEVAFDPVNCEPVLSKSWMVGNDGFATTYLYTESFIRNSTIPGLQRLSAQASNPDSAAYYTDQANVWQQILTYNEELKANAVPYPGLENLSFSNNAPRNRETTRASSEASTIEFNGEINREVATELGLEIAGSGFSGGVIAKLRLELGTSKTNTTLNTLTTGFHLDDDDGGISDTDPGDGFTVDVKVDPVYNTPVFDLLAGQSSCPYEPGTSAREAVSLTADELIIADVPTDGTAVFNLTASNVSETAEDRRYLFRFHPASNPNSAIVEINGARFSDPLRTDFLPASASNTFQVTVRKGAGNISTYQGLEFELYSDCDYTISKKVYLTAIFQNDCSEITLSEPGDDFIANASSNNELSFVVKDYDLDKLEEIALEVAPTGQSSWAALGGPVAGTDLSTSAAGSLLMRSIENFDDGKYDFRVKLGCATSTVFSNRISGLFDRSYPRTLGNPQPLDDNYADGDQISLTFDEIISCEDLSVSLTDVFARNPIAAEVSCFNNTLFITPAIDLSRLEGTPVEVIVSRVQDVNGNENPDRISWTFTAGTSALPNDADGDGVIDALDRCAGADDFRDGDGDGIPDACDLCKNAPSVGLSFDGEDDFLRQNTVQGLDSTHTIEAWIKPSGLPEVRSWPLTLGQRNSGGHHWLLLADGSMQIGVFNGPQISPMIAPDRWTHLATVYARDTLTLYINGFKFATIEASFNFTDQLLMLGRKFFSGETYFAGSIDELRIWNTSRSQAQISAGMREEMSGFEAGLIAYYNFNEGTPGGDNNGNSSVIDLSQNAADASLVNFALTGDASNFTIGATTNALDADNNGFGDTCEPPPVGVNDREPRNFSFTNLYPNPARETVNVTFSSANSQLIYLEMVDLMGRVISEQPVRAVAGQNEISVRLRQLHPGLYLVRLRSKEGISTVRKLIVE